MPYYTHHRNIDTHQMYMFIPYHIILLDKCIITHIKGIWKLTTYFVSMCFQPILMPKCLITHITGIRMYTTMYALLCYQVTLLAECLIIHIT